MLHELYLGNAHPLGVTNAATENMVDFGKMVLCNKFSYFLAKFGDIFNNNKLFKNIGLFNTIFIHLNWHLKIDTTGSALEGLWYLSVL